MPYLSDRFHDQNRNGALPTTDPSTGPANEPNRTGSFDAETVVAAVAERVLGQPAAVEAVRRALVVAQAGLHDRERPLASMLLVGPTGVGKTELVRQVAAGLRAGPDDLCRVDMAQLAQEHYAAALSGAPPGYAGSREGSSVLDRERIEGTPLTPGIVLFDEVEKAHPVVLRALLAALDHGLLRPANGEKAISFRNTLVFLTSNLGSAELARRRTSRWRRALDAAGSVPALGRPVRGVAGALSRRDGGAVSRAVREFFDPEFLNRLDEVVHFGEIAPEVARQITTLRLDDVRGRLARRDVTVRVAPEVAAHLVATGFDPVHGARGLARTVHRDVVAPAAESLVRHRTGPGPDGLVLDVRVDGGRIRISPISSS